MQRLKTFEEVSRLLARKLRDPVTKATDDGTRFSAEDRRIALNDAQYEYVDRSGYLRAQAPITTRESNRIYNLPEDCIRPLRLEDANGKKLIPSDSSQLNQIYGNSFRARTNLGEPKYYYSDLAGDGQFELWPNPETDFTSDPVEITEGTLAVRTQVPESIRAQEVDETMLYILTANFLYYFRIIDDDLILEKTINHALSLSYINSNGKVLNVIKYKRGASSSSATNAAGTVFFINGADIVKVAVDGTISTFGTASSTVYSLLEFEFDDPSILYFQLDTLDLRRTPLSSFSESAVSTEPGLIHQSTGNFTNRDIYFTVESGGLKRLDSSLHTLTSITTNNVSGVGALFDAEEEAIYFVDYTDALIKKIDPSDDSITATVLTVTASYDASHPTNPIATNRNDSFWYVDKETVEFGVSEFFLQEVVEGVKTRKVFTDFIRGNIYRNTRYTVANKDLVFHRTSDGGVSTSSFDHGVLVYVDGKTFDQEEGTIVDVEDDADEIDFSSEFGSFEHFLEDATVAYVNYVRVPEQDRIEIPDHQALLDYASYLLKRQDGDAKKVNESLLHLKEFETRVGKASGKVANGFVTPNTGSRPVRY